MNARTRTIAILAGVLVVLAGTTFWLQSTPATPATPTAAATVVVWDYSSATASQLDVQALTATVSLRIQSGKWRVTAPVQAEADDLQVSQIANQLKKPDATTKVADNATDFAPYGLSSPALTVTLVLSGAVQPRQQLLVGKQNVDGSAYYVRPAGGNAVYLVANTLIEPLKGWLTAPPVAPPTPTALPATLLPAPSAITNTTTLSGTERIPLTPGTGPPGTPGPIGPQLPVAPSPVSTPSTSGPQPPVGASPVSTPPSTGAGASPVAPGSGGGTGSGTSAVVTPTP